MKYAIISDIHGNFPALTAVLEDAKAQRVDKFLLLGDYPNSFPWGNEVVTAIRGLKNAVIIRGNGEDYLIDLKNKNQPDFSLEQFKPIYWSYRTLSEENLNFLTSLPETASISDNNTKIFLQHSMKIFYRSVDPLNIEQFFSRNFRQQMEKEPFTHAEYLAHAHAAVLACKEAMEEIKALPKGIYLFGHNHLQFRTEIDGKLFINPGSCGEPLDFNPSAPYTILTCENDNWLVDERRVSYDIQATAKLLDNSEFTTYAPAWSKVMKAELLTAKDYFMSFVIHIVETGKSMGITSYPPNNDVWEIAVKTWDMEKI
jgi:predicted phosphodiesterase